MAGMTKPLLALADVAKHYDSGAGKVAVLANVNLTVTVGESLAIVGPSGCGKSTLLNIIGTLDRPSSGRVELEGRDLTGLGEIELAAVRNRGVGFVFQAHHLLPQCTVLENVLVPTLPLTDPGLRESAPARARQLLERVGLGERLNHRPGQLSGGERQRVAVVRALINRPKLLLADEPTGALDRHSAVNLGDVLVRLNAEEAVSLIVVTHAIELAKRMQKRFELRDGTLHELVDAH
jgi:ABC-type lipoprotein export system ATPase subunit